LQSVGGINQKFMADSPESAGVNFLDMAPNENTDMIPNDHELTAWTANNFETVGCNKYFYKLIQIHFAQITLQNVSRVTRVCDDRCQQISRRLNDSYIRSVRPLARLELNFCLI
jgi:hypothetical protein